MSVSLAAGPRAPGTVSAVVAAAGPVACLFLRSHGDGRSGSLNVVARGAYSNNSYPESIHIYS